MTQYTITKKCKGCGTEFTTTVNEAKWLEKKGLRMFERCPECRKKKRAAKATKAAETGIIHTPKTPAANDIRCEEEEFISLRAQGFVELISFLEKRCLDLSIALSNTGSTHERSTLYSHLADLERIRAAVQILSGVGYE